MSRGFRNADSTQEMSDQATASAIEEVLKRDREEASHAQDRRAEGAYGRCEQCGREIGEERLAVLPSATRCISCQAAWEQAGLA
ncbi:MAG TPA: TraR/DksA C4-type zinc finger protein [Candidatus Dormibacteraeota bacterium]|jgi:DnaK suppressor protein